MPLDEVFKVLIEESLPEFAVSVLMDRLKACGGSGAEVSVRLNPFKCSGPRMPSAYSGGDNCEDNSLYSEISWCEDGYFLKERKAFTMDPAFHAGAYYVQDSSGMFPSLIKEKILEVVKEGNGAVLDLCASPGGKSTHLISVLSGDTHIKSVESEEYIGKIGNTSALPLAVCNEAIGKRVPPLCDNIAKWGALNVIVTNAFAANLGRLDGFFDVVLADVPCSGEGMFRKSADAVEGWSRKNVEECAILQRSIIEDIWPALRDGGLLIYSTCTYNHLENQDNVRYIAETLGADLISFDSEIDSALGFAGVGEKGVVKLDWGYQFVPGLVPGEGQFFAVLQKRYSDGKGVNVTERGSGQDHQFIMTDGRWNDEDIRMFYNKTDGAIHIVPSGLADKMLKVISGLPANCIRMLGCKVGEAKAGKIVPDADLALCAALSSNGGKYIANSQKRHEISVFMPVAKISQKGKISTQRGASDKAGVSGLYLDFSSVEVDRQTALKFLSKENITPLPDWPQGYILLKFNSLGLGFVNNLGTRCNNLHPLMRRIINKPRQYPAEG